MTTPDPRIDEIQARLEAVTPGEWTYHSGTSVVEVLPKFDLHRFDQMSTDIFKVQESDADGVFAAAAPADVAHLLAELRKRDEALGRALEACDRIIDNADGHKPPGPPHPTREQATACRIRAAVAAVTGGVE